MSCSGWPIGGSRHDRLSGRGAWLGRSLGAREGRHLLGGHADLATLDALQERHHGGDLVVVQADRRLIDHRHDGWEALYEVFLGMGQAFDEVFRAVFGFALVAWLFDPLFSARAMAGPSGPAPSMGQRAASLASTEWHRAQVPLP